MVKPEICEDPNPRMCRNCTEQDGCTVKDLERRSEQRIPQRKFTGDWDDDIDILDHQYNRWKDKNPSTNGR